MWHNLFIVFQALLGDLETTPYTTSLPVPPLNIAQSLNNNDNSILLTTIVWFLGFLKNCISVVLMNSYKYNRYKRFMYKSYKIYDKIQEVN